RTGRDNQNWSGTTSFVCRDTSARCIARDRHGDKGSAATYWDPSPAALDCERFLSRGGTTGRECGRKRRSLQELRAVQEMTILPALESRNRQSRIRARS